MTSNELSERHVGEPHDHHITAELFDREYEAIGRSSLVWRLAAEVFGEDYPAEVQPWGLTTWWLLGRLVSGVRVAPGQQLVDLACGRGGPGLWLARATHAALLGVDWSPVAVRDAAARASEFVPEGRARFVVGDLAATGLPDAVADALICLDGLPFAADRGAALWEAARLLKPGGRYLVTAPEWPAPQQSWQVSDWTPLLETVGLAVEGKEETPGYARQIVAMYRLWSQHLEALRAELGKQVADAMVQRADRAGLFLGGQRHMLITARRQAHNTHGLAERVGQERDESPVP